MKLVIFLALFAVAFADELAVKVVNLDSPPVPTNQMPDLSPLIVSRGVLEAIKNFQYQPVMRDAPVEDESLKVNFVDTPLEAPVAEDNEDLTVHIVDDAPLEAPAAEDNEDLTVHIVDDAPLEAPAAEDDGLKVHFVDDAPLEAPAAEDDEGLKVHFVDDAEVAVPEMFVPEPLSLDEAPLPVFQYDIFVVEPVMIVEAPLPVLEEAEIVIPEPVMIGEAPLPVLEEAEIPQYPGKQFDDPRLRRF